MIYKRLLTCLTFGACSVAGAAETPYEHSGNFMHAQCSPSAAKQHSNCAFYLSGLTKGAFGQAVLTESKELFCVPLGVTNGQLVDVFYKYLDDHPAQRHMDAAVLAFFSLRDAFPCK